MSATLVRRLGVAVAVGVVLVVLALCTTVRGLIDAESALKRAGFTDVDVGFDTADGFDQVKVTLRPSSVEGGAESEANRAAEVMWTTFPLRFDLLRIDLIGPVEGPNPTTHTYSELEQLFGPRPPGLDDKALSDDVVRAGVGFAVVLAVGGLLFLVVVVLAIVLGVRASRRRQSVTPPPWPPVIG